jgi:two-component system, NarL family, sensor histidine kinase UhpB
MTKPIKAQLSDASALDKRNMGLRSMLLAPSPWIVLLIGILATVLIWLRIHEDRLREAESDFFVSAERVTLDIKERIDDYEYILNGGVGLFATAEPVTREKWREYVKHLQVEKELAGFQSLGFAKALRQDEMLRFIENTRRMGPASYQVYPAGQREEYVPVLYIEPESSLALHILGYDMFSEPVHRDAIERARDSGATALTGRITLLRKADGAEQAGFIMYVPVYRGGQLPATREARRANLAGFVYAPIRANNFLDMAIRNSLGQMSLEVFDGLNPGVDGLLFSSDKHSGATETGRATVSPMFNKRLTTNFSGRLWTFDFHAGPDFLAKKERWDFNLVLVAGGAISILLFVIVGLLARTRQIALDVASEVKAAALEREEQFSGIVRTANEAIITIDESQNIVMFNPAAERIFKLTAKDAIGAPLSRLLPERFREAHRERVTRFAATDTAERQMGSGRELFGLRSNGDEFPVEASISQFHHRGRRFSNVILRDIGVRRRAEQALLTSHEKLRELSAHMQTVREDEKKHIARELHDDLGQQLTALKMDLAGLESMLLDADSGVARRIESINTLVDTTVGAVRRIAADLRPAMLDDLGLTAAIEWLTEDYSRRYAIRMDVVVEGMEMELESTAATALFRIVQEALTNVARHSQASVVTVTIKSDERELFVEIHDNGQGISTADQQKRNSFGLIGMQERVMLLGGKITISGEPGVGTTIFIAVPSMLKPDGDQIHDADFAGG